MSTPVHVSKHREELQMTMVHRLPVWHVQLQYAFKSTSQFFNT